MIACVRYRDVERILLGEGFVCLGVFEDHLVFESPDRAADKPRYCSIHIPNPMDTIAETSLIESLERAEIDIPQWDVVWSD